MLIPAFSKLSLRPQGTEVTFAKWRPETELLKAPCIMNSRKRKTDDNPGDALPPRPPPPSAMVPLPRTCPPVPPPPAARVTKDYNPCMGTTSITTSIRQTTYHHPTGTSVNTGAAPPPLPPPPAVPHPPGQETTPETVHADDTKPVVKIGFSLGGPKITVPAAAGSTTAGQIGKKVTVTSPMVVKSKKKVTAASIFGNDDDDDDEDEMPPEARMRMRNCGKYTPTSSGPNTFSKTNKGFTDPRGKVWDKVDDSK